MAQTLFLTDMQALDMGMSTGADISILYGEFTDALTEVSRKMPLDQLGVDDWLEPVLP